jgi:hypothetical protein
VSRRSEPLGPFATRRRRSIFKAVHRLMMRKRGAFNRPERLAERAEPTQIWSDYLQELRKVKPADAT